MFSNRSPPGRDNYLGVPIDPSIDLMGKGTAEQEKVAACKARNGGRWVYPIAEFADMMADGTRDLTMDLLERCMVIVPDALSRGEA